MEIDVSLGMRRFQCMDPGTFLDLVELCSHLTDAGVAANMVELSSHAGVRDRGCPRF